MRVEKLRTKIEAHSSENGCSCAEEFAQECKELSLSAGEVPQQMLTYWLRTIESYACDEEQD
jgi:hypothetical protein